VKTSLGAAGAVRIGSLDKLDPSGLRRLELCRVVVVPDAAAEHGVRVLSPICTHKGCNVAWSTEEALFACPCHRGRFDVGGAPVSGPPNAPLARVAMRVDEGHLWAELGSEATA